MVLVSWAHARINCSIRLHLRPFLRKNERENNAKVYLIYILAERSVGARSGAPEAPVRTFIEHGNLSKPENLVLTSAYPRAPEHSYRLWEQW